MRTPDRRRRDPPVERTSARAVGRLLRYVARPAPRWRPGSCVARFSWSSLPPEKLQYRPGTGVRVLNRHGVADIRQLNQGSTFAQFLLQQSAVAHRCRDVTETLHDQHLLAPGGPPFL